MFSSWLWQTSWLCYEVNKHRVSRFSFFQCKYVVKHQNMIVWQTGTLYQNKLETNMRSSCKQLNLGKVKEKKSMCCNGHLKILRFWILYINECPKTLVNLTNVVRKLGRGKYLNHSKIWLQASSCDCSSGKCYIICIRIVYMSL